VMLKVLAQYAETTGDPRVVPFMTRYFRYERAELPRRPLRDWGKYRWQDNVYTVLWLYNRTGEAHLLQLARLLHDQGYNWEAQFADFKFTGKETREKLGLTDKGPIPDMAMQTHGVNNAMALKAAPIWWLVSGQARDRAALYDQLHALDKYHGLPNGMFSGDEHFAGPDPSQGIELCAVVESMFSYETAFAIFGDARLADRLERITYNALPATLSNDMWSHQYDQQPNQIACTRAHRQWSTNGDDSNLFGLEPNFGCCTANLHQGWPKFISSLWMASKDGGLVVTAYAPSEVKTAVRGREVMIREETEYPFRNTVRLTVIADGARQFPLLLRLLGWAKSATITVNGEALNPVSGATTRDGFYTVRRNWESGDHVEIAFDMEPRVTHWYHNSAVFERGPLVFSLPLDGAWSEVKRYAEKSADWEVKPRKPWNLALRIGDCAAKVKEGEIGDAPFDINKVPVSLQIEGRTIPQWREQENSAGPLPLSPVTATSAPERLTLVPYGAAKLRITAFPYLAEKATCQSGSAETKGIGK